MPSWFSWSAITARLTGRPGPLPVDERPAPAPLSLARSLPVRQQAMQQAEQAMEWKAAARIAAELCNAWLLLGEWQQVQTTAAQGEAWLARQDDPLTRIYLHTRLATAQHRLGAWQESRATFQEAEKWQAGRDTGYHWLIGLPGQAYCDLLLDQAREASEWEMVLHRSHYSQKVARNVFAVALDLQTQGRALAALGQQETARATFAQAVATLRKANRRAFLPEVLLHQANHLRSQGETPATLRPLLDEALTIATDEGLRPATVHGNLLAGHLLLDEGKETEAATALFTAETILDELGYEQCRVAADILRARLLWRQGQQAAAGQWRDRTRQMIEQHGQWSLLPAWERETAFAPP
ncbi:MAG: hypothetical protein H7838_13385 [Magnetococcus sp. DMHC-8]